MKVSKLIALLQQFDGDTEVYHNNLDMEYGDDLQENFRIDSFSQGVVITQYEYLDPRIVFSNPQEPVNVVDNGTNKEMWIPKLFEQKVLDALNQSPLLDKYKENK